MFSARFTAYWDHSLAVGQQKKGGEGERGSGIETDKTRWST